VGLSQSEEQFVIHRINQHTPEELIQTHSRCLKLRQYYELGQKHDRLSILNEIIMLIETRLKDPNFMNMKVIQL